MTDIAQAGPEDDPPPLVSQTTIEFKRPWLYEKQFNAIYDPRRISCIEASTKSGKTVGCITWLVEQALFGGGDGRNYWWIAPVMTQATIAFTRMMKFMRPEMFTLLVEPSYLWYCSTHSELHRCLGWLRN